MKIDELLNKYFEGETSCEEERELRRYFTETDKLPEHLQTYRPLFTYLEQEANANAKTEKTLQPQPPSRKPARLRRMLYVWSGIAAGVLLLAGVAQMLSPLPDTPESFVIIDGKRYTDKKLAEAKAQEAMQIAGFTDEYLDGLLFGN